jgi:dTDP-4-dehydrorhamnose reductase
MRVLVLGATGMLGSSVIKILSENLSNSIFGTIQSQIYKDLFSAALKDKLIISGDLLNIECTAKLIRQISPNVIINCVGIVKQLASSDDPLRIVPINSLFPHQIARICQALKIRMIHISTDCVFSGNGNGNYLESDISDATDLYGKTKYIGEVSYPNTITLRTSIIGHELRNAHGLVEWFLSQSGSCVGYSQFLFSGLPAIVLAKIIRDVVIPREEMQGVFHIASEPISKYSLLRLIAQIYEKDIEIVPSEAIKINRTLNPRLFNDMTGYLAPDWSKMVMEMKNYRENNANV